MGASTDRQYRWRLYDRNTPKHEEGCDSELEARTRAQDFATQGRNKHQYGTTTGRFTVVVEKNAGPGTWTSVTEYSITPIQKGKN